MYIEVHVIPNSRENSISHEGGNKLKVKVKAKAEANKANMELLSMLSEKFGCSFQLIKGSKSRKKILQADCDEKTFLEAINLL